MRAQPPAAPDRPPPAAAGRSRDVSGDPGPSFAELLALDPAWTAPAGGHGTRPEQAPATKAGARDGQPARERDQRPAVPATTEPRDQPTTSVPGVRATTGTAAGPADGQPSAAPAADVAAAVDAARMPPIAAPAAITAAQMQAFAAAATTPAGAAPAVTTPTTPVTGSASSAPTATQPALASLAATIAAPATPGEPVIAPLGDAPATAAQPEGLHAPPTPTVAAVPQPPATSPGLDAARTGAETHDGAPRGDVPATAPASATPAPAAPAVSESSASPAGDVPVPAGAATGSEAPAPTTMSAPAAQPTATPAAAPQAPASASAASASAAATMAAAPATPAAAAGTQAPAQGVVLSQAAEAVEHVLRLSQEHGIRHARIALRPVELGGVEIQLRSTAAGLSARIVADAPEAAHLLRAAGNDLSAALERQGVTLVELEIAHAPTAAADPRSGGAGARADTGDQPNGRDDRPAGPAHPTDTDIPVTTVLELPDGVLVDVLA